MQTIVVNFEAGALQLAQQIFGVLPADDVLADLAGALDGATVTVSVRRIGLYLTMQHPWFECYETSVRIDQQGVLFAYIHDVRKRGREPKAVLAQAFSKQVSAARKLGIVHFELFAAGLFEGHCSQWLSRLAALRF